MKSVRNLVVRLFIALSLVFSTTLFAAETVEVWKDPNCGCCGLWVEHLQAAGFKVRVNKRRQRSRTRPLYSPSTALCAPGSPMFPTPI